MRSDGIPATNTGEYFDSVTKLRIFINCGPCEEFVRRCIASVQEQSYSDWAAWVTVDACGDGTYEQAELAADGDRRMHIHRNAVRAYSLSNLVHAIRRSQAEPEDVIVCLDGDDWFAHRDALLTIVAAYEQFDCWATYGSWVSNVPSLAGGHDGMWPAYPDDTTDFRNHRFLGTAVRTWKKWLWDCIRDEDLRGDTGEYVKVSEDQMIMIPILEMCGTKKARHIAEPIMIYNKLPKYPADDAIAQEGLANSALIDRRPRYPRLEGKVSSQLAISD